MKIDKKELKELFIEIKQNNYTAFEELYKKYSKMVYGIAFSILKNIENSEDIVQIVYTKIYQMEKSKLPTENEASWLYSLTKNETLNFLKSEKNDIPLDNLYEIPSNNDELNEIIDKIEFNRLISKLNDKEKEIIALKILSNFSFEEISNLKNEPIGTVKWRYYKSLYTIKLALGNLGMFIVTFVIGIKTLITNNKDKEINQPENIENGEFETNNQTVINETTKSQNEEEMPQEKTEDNTVLQDKISNQTENEIINEQTIVEENIKIQDNYTGIGFISISIIFLIISIFFFIKNQPKYREKLSKQ